MVRQVCCVLTFPSVYIHNEVFPFQVCSYFHSSTVENSLESLHCKSVGVFSRKRLYFVKSAILLHLSADPWSVTEHLHTHTHVCQTPPTAFRYCEFWSHGHTLTHPQGDRLESKNARRGKRKRKNDALKFYLRFDIPAGKALKRTSTIRKRPPMSSAGERVQQFHLDSALPQYARDTKLHSGSRHCSQSVHSH